MKPKEKDVITIGLFGTCGNSQWRTSFIEYYQKNRIEYFNPVVPDWKPENAVVEADHLVSDEIILFPVTDETYGTGSLAEIGFSIAQAIKSNKEGFVVIYIAPKVSDKLVEQNPILAKDSNKARALCLGHLHEQKDLYPNVYIVDSLERMFEVSVFLYKAMVYIKEARSLTI